MPGNGMCKAACCRLNFALSCQDVEEGVVQWDFAHPYLIARGRDGYCRHMDRQKMCCSVHAQRPVPCRAYDCRKDKRIWADFEKKVVNPELGKLFPSLEEKEAQTLKPKVVRQSAKSADLIALQT